MATDRSKKTKARADASREFVTLAHKYNPKKHGDCIGWLFSEKLDGVRARFHKGKLYSRSQKIFPAPPWYTQFLTDWFGNLELDGELIVNKDFQTTVSLVRNEKNSKLNPSLWSIVSYNIFDVIAPGNYENRINQVAERIKQAEKISNVNTFIFKLHDQSVLKSPEQIQFNLVKVLKYGGEGLILRNPNAEYEFGRTHNLLKVKQTDSCEVIVKGYYPGEGRNEGVVGGLICTTDTNKTIRVGTGLTDLDRKNPPSIGSIITIKHMGLTNDGIPRHPVFICERNYE